MSDILIVFYKEICLTQQPCKNAGSCVRNSCEPEGYSCICSELFYGKHCENENSKLDHS